MPKMLVPLAEGFEEIEAITIIDVCRRGGIDVTVAGVTEMTIKGGQGIEVAADCLIDSLDINSYDMITLPGGLAGTLVLSESENVQSILKQMKEQGKYIGAICAAPLALHTAEVLNEEVPWGDVFHETVGIATGDLDLTFGGNIPECDIVDEIPVVFI